jgi:hypothetical protein
MNFMNELEIALAIAQLFPSVENISAAPAAVNSQFILLDPFACEP